MKKEFEQKDIRGVYIGFIWEATQSDEAREKSYDDMRCVGKLIIGDKKEAEGDDLNDAPFDCNGSIFTGKNSGQEILLEKGNIVIVIKN